MYEGNNEKINSGAMLRYLAEKVRFPSSALNGNMQWDPMNANAAKATVTTDGNSVSGIFRF